MDSVRFPKVSELAYLLILTIILIVSEEAASKGARGGGRYGGRRSSSRYRSGTRSTAWKAGVVAGTYYGSRSYMRRRRYYSDKAPSICTNYYDTDGNGTVFGRFVCPLEWQSDEMDECCGDDNREKCCESSGLSSGAIAGIVIAVLIATAVIAMLIYFKAQSSTRQHHFSEYMKPKNDGDPVILSDPPPVPASKYDAHPQRPASSSPGFDETHGNVNYGMTPDQVGAAPSAPPPNVPYGMHPQVAPPSYDSSIGGSVPYPPAGEMPYPPPGNQPYPPPMNGDMTTGQPPYPTKTG